MNNQRISNTLSHLNHFATRIDEDGDFSQDAMLYYQKLKSGKYLVANHFNRKKRIELQGFDLWLCEYNDGDEPGLGTPLEINELKLGFQLPRDWSIIDQVS